MAFLKFNEYGVSPSGKTKIWRVEGTSGNTTLAWVIWYAPWRKYCASLAGTDVVFDAGCFRELADFCEQKTREHKNST